MSETIELEILTPMGAKRDGIRVPGVEVPGAQGELGILPSHEPLITAIVPGVLRFYEGTQSVRLAVGSGFAEVRLGGRVTVLVDRALERAEINVAKAREELAAALAELQQQRTVTSIDDPKTVELQRRCEWLEAQVRVGE